MRNLLALLLLPIILHTGEVWGQTTSIRNGTGGDTAQVTNGALSVNITGGGGSGGTSATDNSVFTGGTTGVNPMGALYDTTPPAVTDGSIGAPRMSASRYLIIECATGCGGSGGTSAADNSAFTFGTTTLTPSGYVFDDTTPNAATENRVATPRMSGNRVPYGILRDAAGNERGANVNASNQLSVSVDNTVSLPTGAATAAKQPALGTAGVASGDVMTVQGIASMTPLIVGDGAGAFNIICDSGCGAGTQYAEDTAHVSGDQLSMAGVVQQSADAALSTNGNRSVLQVDATGYAKVNIKTSVLPTGAATSANQSTIIGHVDGIEGLLTTIDGDTGAISLANGATGDVAATAGSTGSLSAKQRLMTTQLDAIQTSVQTLDNAISGAGFNITQLNGVNITMGNGASGTGVQRVTMASDSTGIIAANGTVAHDSADSGAPVKIGFVAETALSTATMVADGDVTKAYAGIDGVQITRPHANLEDRVSGVVGITDGSSTQVVVAQGVGLRFCATTLVVSNSSATNVTVDIRDGTAGSVLMTIPAAANMGGAVVSLQTPLCTTANTIFAADPSVAASTVAISAVGFKTKL